MTRTSVYSAALVAFVAATVMTIASIIMPNWVSMQWTTDYGNTLHDRIGLYQRCKSTGTLERCDPFPESLRYLASGHDRLWRTAELTMTLAAVIELASVVAFMVILAGGKARREKGWRVLGGLLAVVALLQLFALALVTYVFDYDDFFLVPGYRLDSPVFLVLFSVCIGFLSAFGLAVSAFVLPPEEGYVRLLDHCSKV
ncbi:hypothetical protein B0H63DRAFT_478047 [Podospora didyma]|uniref:Uncharacterized protein n=1 Tax=Podospora didyma TaxID=330526 RepID=A0AAE0KKB4_9PEZI|nr:hypothetical protein B0H63DRAFT_478047 [Podospora didyma]